MKLNKFSALFLVCAINFCTTSISRSAVNVLLGDQQISADSSENELGDLDIAGGLFIGSTATNIAGFSATYQDSDSSILHTASKNNARYSWLENGGSTPLSVKTKMTLTSTNILDLYQSGTTTKGLSLDPNHGKIIFGGDLNGLYTSTGTEIMKFSSNGNVLINSTVLIGSTGIDFGNGAKFDSADAKDVNDLLDILGYQNKTGDSIVSSMDLQGNIKITDVDKIYVVGNYTGSGCKVGAVSLPDTQGLTWGVVLIIDANGKFTGTYKIIKSSQSVNLTSVAGSDGLPGFYLGGSYRGTMQSFNTWNRTSVGGDDAFVAFFSSGINTYDTTAQMADAWMRYIGGPGDDQVNDIACPNQNLGQIENDISPIVVGEFRGTAQYINPIDPGPSSSSLTTRSNGGNASARDGFIIEFDTPWSNEENILQIGGSGDDTVNYISAPYGNIQQGGTNLCYVVGGDFGSTLSANFGKYAGMPQPWTYSAGGRDAFVMKIGYGSSIKWFKALGGASADSVKNIIYNNSDEKIYFLGGFGGATTNFGAGKNATPVTAGGGIAARLDGATGAVDWASSGASNSYEMNSLAFGGDGSLIVGGSSKATSGAVSGQYLKMTAATGSLLSSQAFGNGGGESVLSIAKTSSGMYLNSISASSNYPIGGIVVSPTGLSRSIVVSNSMPIVSTSSTLTSTGFAWLNSTASGNYSTSFGKFSVASGENSVALGGASAQGNNSIAMGAGNATGISSVSIGGAIATGDFAIALGLESEASGGGALAGGQFAIASGINSIALGSESGANGICSFAVGANAWAASDYSGAIGYSTGAYGNYSMAIGSYSYALAPESFSFGSGCETYGERSMALGFGNLAYSYASTKIGSYALDYDSGNQNEWVSTDPLLQVGNGNPDTYERSDAITTLKNGQTTLTNKEWNDDPDVVGTVDNSNGNALVVKGHTEMHGNTTVNGKTTLNGKTVLNGQVLISERQGDISMGIYSN